MQIQEQPKLKLRKEKEKEKKVEYPTPIHEKVDNITKELVYEILSKDIEKNNDKIKKIINSKKYDDLRNVILITPESVKQIKDEIYKKYPNIESKISEIQLELGILHYIAKFFYDFTDNLNKQYPEINVKRIRRGLILANIYNVAFTVLKQARSFMLQQISYYLIFNERVNRKVLDLLYKYSKLDEEQIVVKCLNDICGLSLYKVNFFVSKNISAVFKTLIKISLSYILSVKLFTDEEIDDQINNITYYVFNDFYELETFQLSSFTFLFILLSSTYKQINLLNYHNLPVTQKIILDTIRDNYTEYNKVVPNVFRQIYVISKLNVKELKDIFGVVYNDIEELFKLESDIELRKKIQQQYPELHKFIKALTIRINDKVLKNKRVQLVRINKNILAAEISQQLNNYFLNIIDEDVINEISTILSIKTYKFFNNTIFIHPISNSPILSYNNSQLHKDIAKLYINFILGAKNE